jgi:glutamine synthetase
MGDGMLVFAPHANSWRRYVANLYAPVSPSWGCNDRSVALRVPAGDVAARRVEHRPAGVDANPYLVAATVLAGIRHGIDQQVDPGPPAEREGYSRQGPFDTTMPRDWHSALIQAETSDFLKSALGPALHRSFCAIKRAELGRVMATVTELDYQLYLHQV